jgi:hypothetical protein
MRIHQIIIILKIGIVEKFQFGRVKMIKMHNFYSSVSANNKKDIKKKIKFYLSSQFFGHMFFFLSFFLFLARIEMVY